MKIENNCRFLEYRPSIYLERDLKLRKRVRVSCKGYTGVPQQLWAVDPFYTVQSPNN